jgi:hypothetical protein
MRSIVSVAIVLALAACGGSSSTGSGSGGGGGTTGSETPVVSGEDEGFDDDGADGEAVIDHGSQSPHELIGVHPPPTPWDSMSAEEREWYMVGVFLPIEGESFAHYDAERFSRFECENCHGDDARANHFAMPSRSLPPLAAPGTPQWEQMSHGPAFAFMHDTVVPECATMLGEQPVSAENPNGFGCFNCHPHAQ